MKTNLRFFGLVGTVSMALVASACSGGAELDSQGIDEEKAQAMAEDFEFVPADEGDRPVTSMEAVGKDSALTGKGASEVTRGFTWYEQISIPNGATVTYETRDGNDTIDPVLVLFMRTAPWNSTQWIASPYTDKVGIRTLAQNDDANPPERNARITWTNREGQAIQAWVMGFAWSNKVGELEVLKDGASIGRKSFASGSVKTSTTAGQVYTTGGGDPVLFAFSTNTDPQQRDLGAWNDDDPQGGTDSRIPGFTNQAMWLVPMVYPSFSRQAGTTTINY